MTNQIFRLKEFNVSHAKSSMKVGTDSMILGSFSQNENPVTILDIGTGCGILALMMAQKYPEANVLGIDIHTESIEEAEYNFSKSKFSEIRAQNTSLQDLVSNTTTKFDLIISNPPFFKNDLKSDNSKRNLARHNDELSFEDLIKQTEQLMTEKAKFWFILPSRYEGEINEIIQKSNLFLSEKIQLFNDDSKTPVRIIFCLSFIKDACKTHQLKIRKNNSYTSEYIELTKNYHFNKL